MIKKTIASMLAAIMLAACLASCGAPASTGASQSARIRTTSSDASDAAAWLADRLGERLTGGVVLGTDGEAYGVDISTLEDDGFFIRSFGREDVFNRSFGREDVLFAKTPDGLDRAVRKYAKTVERGAAVTNVTFHEGYRVKRLTIAGRDISEYTIYCEDEEYMLDSAALLSGLIEKACGAKPAVSTGAPEAPYILLSYVHDGALSTCGYRWSVTGDGLTIECSDGYKPSASYCAVTRFLEKRFDWFGLYFGFEDLTPCELISIEAGESGGEANAFQHVIPGTDDEPGDRFEHSYPQLCGISHACHGLSNNKFGGELSADPDRAWEGDQPCYLDEDFLEASVEDVKAYIAGRLDSGAVIGEDLCYIDIAAGDNPYWCSCRKCTEMFRAEGTVAASVVTWANALAEEVDGEYPGLVYQTFAYYGTNKAPKSVAPNDLVYVTFCYDTSCDMHAHDGRDCEIAGYPHIAAGHDNISRASQLEAWLALTDNVYVWYYSMGQGFMTLNYVDMALADMRYFYDVGVKGFYMESHDGQTKDTCFGALRMARWAMNELTWDIGMTDEEYYAYLDRVTAVMYGSDSAPFVRAYADATAKIQRQGPCTHCWWSASRAPTLVTKLIARDFDTLYSLLQSAISGADSAAQEMRSSLLSAACIYQGCLSSYFDAYGEGDDARCAELSRRYARIVPILERYGFDVSRCWFGGWDGSFADFNADMEMMAWSAWAEYSDFVGVTVPQRPMPARVAAILN